MLTRVNCKAGSGPNPALARYLAGGSLPVSESVRTIGQPQRLTKFAGPKRDEYVARYEEAVEARRSERPNPDEAVIVPVRFISAALVEGHWMNHSDPEHLKVAHARGLFDTLAVHVEHKGEAEFWVGYAVDSEWDDTKLGREKAPGISGYVAIEKDVSPLAKVVAAGVARRSLKRWSLCFQADYEYSHSEMAGWDFMDHLMKLGTAAPDDRIYCFDVNAILDVYEFSVVSVGAIDGARTTDAPNSMSAKPSKDAAQKVALSRPAIPRIYPVRPSRG